MGAANDSGLRTPAPAAQAESGSASTPRAKATPTPGPAASSPQQAAPSGQPTALAARASELDHPGLLVPAPPLPDSGVVSFVGEVAMAGWRALQGRASVRGSGLMGLLDQAGPACLPIVALTSALLGVMLAYMGGAQLVRMGAESYIASVVAVGVVRELAAFMTGIILAGRVGAAFAAQLATMQAGEEIDALRTLGVEPAEFLVLPRVLALMLAAPLLLILAMAVGVLASAPAAVWGYGMDGYEYLVQCLGAITWTHLWIGLFKGTLYAALVALAGCQEGLAAGRTAQAVGVATTRAVVKALVWIVVAACGSTIVLTSLGY